MKRITYGAFFEGKLVGTRTSPTMKYTHVLLARAPGEIDWAATNWSQSSRGAENLRTEFLRYRPGRETQIVPAVVIDKKTGKPIEVAHA